MKTEESLNSTKRVVAVLKSFNSSNLELSASEISQRAGLPNTTTRRILVTLTESGLLGRHVNTGNYTVGPALFVLGSLYLNTMDILRTAERVIKTINELTNEAVSVGNLYGGNVIFIIREESKHIIRVVVPIGTIFPAYASAAGKALLSELTEAQIDRLYPKERLKPLTRKTITTKTELKLELERIRKTGVCFDQESAFEGLEGVASLTRDASGKAVASMSIAAPVFRMNQAKRERLANLVKLGCSLVSYQLGYQDKDYPIHSIQELRSLWKQDQLGSVSQINTLSTAEPITHNGTVEEE